MKILVLGATGATGRLLVQQLLERGHEVGAIVRSPDQLPEVVRKHAHASVIQASILGLSDAEMAQHVKGCVAVASCLGHNLSLRGVLGPPRRLVTDATRRLCRAIKSGQPQGPVRFVLMNTAGNSNRDLSEPVSFGQRCVIGALRLLLPPHVDNEKAADYLRTRVGQDDRSIQWVAVRPDTLIDEDQVTKYEVHASPTRSAPAICLLLAMLAATRCFGSEPVEEISLAALPPSVVRTVPQCGDDAVSPSLSEVSVTFSKDMKVTGHCWSWCGVRDDAFPVLAGETRFLTDQRTCVLTVALQPERTYAIWINTEEYHSFQDPGDHTAVPYLLVFRTAASDQPEPADAGQAE